MVEGVRGPGWEPFPSTPGTLSHQRDMRRPGAAEPKTGRQRSLPLGSGLKVAKVISPES